MSIHQSKGLEFPVVAVPDLGKPFNFSESKKTFLPDDKYGLCSMVQPENSGQTYPSFLFGWRGGSRSSSPAGEEMRILYVALTRAENLLLLFGSTSQNRPPDNWSEWAKENRHRCICLEPTQCWTGLAVIYGGKQLIGQPKLKAKLLISVIGSMQRSRRGNAPSPTKCAPRSRDGFKAA